MKNKLIYEGVDEMKAILNIFVHMKTGKSIDLTQSCRAKARGWNVEPPCGPSFALPHSTRA